MYTNSGKSNESYNYNLYLGHGGQQGDEVGEGEADQVAVGGGVETLGAPHGDDHHHVTQHPGQQDGRLEHCADDPELIFFLLELYLPRFSLLLRDSLFYPQAS